ncbi:MAG: purine nucleoside permease [bacterium]|nr:purine nucleoside permease [bacterium]
MNKIKLKILLVTAYSSENISNIIGEDEYFIKREKLINQLPVTGAFSPLHYNDKGIGLIITGIGIANASSSIMAIGLSEKIDLSDTDIIIAGIGGLLPDKGPLGTVVCVKNIINDLCFEIDPRELDKTKKFYKEKLPWLTGSEVFTLNNKLVEKNYTIISESTDINVIMGDNLTSDCFWHGKKLADWSENWVKEWTNNKGCFCISDMEDSGIITAFKRLSDAEMCSFDKIAIIRTASNYVYEPKIDPSESIKKHDSFALAVENTYQAVKIIIENILSPN